MMTLAEGIRHAEECAKKCDTLAETSVTDEARGDNHLCAEEHKQLAEWLKELQRYQWIPVEERLPHDGEKILACYDDGCMLAMQFHAWARFSFVAWMPLPDPYEPKEADE